MRTGRVGLTPRDLGIARALRDRPPASRLGTVMHEVEDLPRLARQLADGFRVNIKIAGGQNVQRMLHSDLARALGQISLGTETAYTLMADVVSFCLSKETSRTDGELEFPERLQGISFDLGELTKLQFATRGSGLEFEDLLDDLVRLKASQAVLRKRRESLVFGQQPLVAIRLDNAELLLALKAEGIDIADLEGAIDFCQDGTIEPPVTEKVVQVADLMQALEDVMG